MIKTIGVISVFITMVLSVTAQNQNSHMVVAKDGSGNYKTIGDAIESLPMYCYERVTIYIKNGVYNEKFKIEQDYITLIGESRDSTIIEYDLLRENWIENKDDIGPAVINIYADDIILKNLTIENTQPLVGPHAFAIYGTGTRTILLNCTVLSKGGDTVSLWDYKTGMYYHDSCHFQGAVDFVCPRGWCYISNSSFFEVKRTAAVWHAAPVNPNQKFVLKNCSFQGADSFYLARHHYEAQFYFLNCTFPSIMLNKPIEHVVYEDKPEKNRPFNYGERYYFYNCTRKGGDYAWHKDNLSEWPNRVAPQKITPEWTFDGQWNPVDSTSLKVDSIEIADGKIALWFDEIVMKEGQLAFETASKQKFQYVSGSGSYRLLFESSKPVHKNIVNEIFFLISGQVLTIKATKSPRTLEEEFNN